MITDSAGVVDISADRFFPALRDHIIDITGLAFYASREEDFADRVARRIARSCPSDCAGYLDLLMDPDRGPAELDRLVGELTIGETSFFRHCELFDGIRTLVLPELLERNRRQRRLRIWSAGCSTGAEPYSLAILLADEFGAQTAGWDVSILGTDINRAFLARAQEGKFGAWALRGLSSELLERCFQRCGEDRVIRPDYQKFVCFQYHNLVHSPFPSLIHNLIAFDLILCRNVLIYFSHEVTARLVPQFHAALVDGGWLLVGHAEPNVELFRGFETFNVPDAVLYRRPLNPREAKAARVVEPTADVPAHADPITPPPRRSPATFKGSASKAPEVAARKRAGTSPQTSHNDQGSRGPGHDNLPADLLSDVRRLTNAGDLAAARQACADLTLKHPMAPAPHLHLAMIAEQLGDHHCAEMSLRRALYLEPDNVLARYYSGVLGRQLRRWDEAGRSFSTVLALLNQMSDEARIAGADGVCAGDLREMTRRQQEALNLP